VAERLAPLRVVPIVKKAVIVGGVVSGVARVTTVVLIVDTERLLFVSSATK
jgi:hypothetical protein